MKQWLSSELAHVQSRESALLNGSAFNEQWTRPDNWCEPSQIARVPISMVTSPNGVLHVSSSFVPRGMYALSTCAPVKPVWCMALKCTTYIRLPVLISTKSNSKRKGDYECTAFYVAYRPLTCTWDKRHQQTANLRNFVRLRQNQLGNLRIRAPIIFCDLGGQYFLK